MVTLTVSIWILFFALFLTEPDSITEAQSMDYGKGSKQSHQVVKVNDHVKEESQDHLKEIKTEKQEESNVNVSQIDNQERAPESIEERASSRFNHDILYDFEVKGPISVDALLTALDLN